MNARIGLRLGGITAAVACAFLVACGGGGGGGSTLPSTTTSTPTIAPTTAPTTQATSAPLSTSRTTPLSFGAVSNNGATVINSATMTLPAVSAATTASVSLSAAVPSGIAAPSARTVHLKHADTLGVPATALAYFAVSVSSTVSISTSPALTIAFNPAQTGNCYVVTYDPTAGWTGLLGPQPCGATVTFPSVAINPAFTLQAGATYYFAVVTTSSTIATPTPMPTPTLTATPTATATPSSGPSSTPNPAGTVVPGNGTPLAGPTYGPLITGPGWGPRGVADQLDFPVQHGWDGSGIKVAIVIDSCVSQSDWNTFFTYFSIPNSSRVTCKAVDGASLTPNADNGEAALDSETIASLAPGATVTLYVIPSLGGTYIDDAYSKAIADGNQVVNSSFGGCEYAGITPDTVIAGGAANGVSFFASAGDQGNECYIGPGPTDYQVGVNNPASDPNVIGVGGTQTTRTANQITSATVWNDNTCGGQCAGGGGVSLMPIPTYQNTTNITSTASSASFRNVPDISFPGEDVAVFVGGSWVPLNGTSWSAPIASGLFATLYQYCGVTSIANPENIPYTVFNHSQYGAGGAFIDVIHGNDQFNSTSPFYTAGTGYDDASGIGVPMGMTFTNTLCPGRSGVQTSARPAYMAASYMEHARPVDVTFDARPHVMGLSDLGLRGGNVLTSVQALIRPTATIASDEQTVIEKLRDAGFTITQTFPNHLVVDAVAPASTVNAFFRTQLHDLNQGRYGVRYAPMTSATIPASIAPYVSRVHLGNVVTHFVPFAR